MKKEYFSPTLSLTESLDDVVLSSGGMLSQDPFANDRDWEGLIS